MWPGFSCRREIGNTGKGVEQRGGSQWPRSSSADFRHHHDMVGPFPDAKRLLELGLAGHAAKARQDLVGLTLLLMRGSAKNRNLADNSTPILLLRHDVAFFLSFSLRIGRFLLLSLLLLSSSRSRPGVAWQLSSLITRASITPPQQQITACRPRSTLCRSQTFTCTRTRARARMYKKMYKNVM